MDLQDIEHIDGSDVTPGVQQNLYYARMADIKTLPKPVLDDSSGDGSFANLVTISADIIMKPGKKFHKLYCTIETGKLDGNLVGEFDGKSFNNELSFVHPGNKPEVLGFAQWAKNSNLVFLAADQDGQVRLLGHEGYPAKMMDAPTTTGDTPESRKQAQFTFKSNRKGPAPIFKGNVKVPASGGGSTYEDQEIVFID